MKKPERHAGIKEYLKARFTSTETQISAVTAPSLVFQGSRQLSPIGLHPRLCSVVKQIQDWLCSSEHNFIRAGH